MDVADHLVFGRARGADRDDRELVVEQRDGAVLQLTARRPLCVDVGDLLELQGAFQRDRVTEPAPGVHEVAVAAVLGREVLDLLVAGKDAANLLRQVAQRIDQLLPALQRNPSFDTREAQSEQIEADHVRVQRLGRRGADLRP